MLDSPFPSFLLDGQGAHKMPRLSHKVALITGGGTGIGRACALLFAKEGAQVAVAGRRIEPLQAVVQELKAAGREAFAVTCDVANRASVDSAIAAATNRFDRLNVVVNNAGAVVVATVEETSDEDWHRLLEINLTGTFFVSRAVLPALRKAGGGSIVNIGSILGLISRKQRAAYSAAKAGVAGLTRAMALDHAHENIRVNCVCPSIIETELGLQSMAKAPNPEAEYKNRVSAIPLARLGKPEDVAQMALYLASDESAWVTGASLPLDGGLTAY
jgi:meso-butanediol dehydrogenase / (S,S)-butanediol dehydrogenase / diacetyl reductase